MEEEKKYVSVFVQLCRVERTATIFDRFHITRMYDTIMDKFRKREGK